MSSSSSIGGWFVLKLAIPLLVIIAGIGAVIVMQPGTLATRTVNYDGSSFAFRLQQRHGEVFAKCMVSPRGATDVIGLGSTTELDTSDAEILLDETVGVVTLRVGHKTVKYNLATHTIFYAPNP